MADEPETENKDEDETPAAEEQAEQPTADGTPVEAESPEPAAEPQAAAEPAAEAAAEPAEDGQGGDAGAPEQTAGEPEEKLSSKQRRRVARSTHTGEARPQRSPEERHAERLAVRKAKASRRRTRRAREREKAAERRRNAPAAEPLAPVHARVEGVAKVRQGIVVSDKADKTITVRIDVARRHRRYEKIVRSSSTLHAHDENNDANQGDTVRVIESRPLSRTKRWKLVEVLERAR